MRWGERKPMKRLAEHHTSADRVAFLGRGVFAPPKHARRSARAGACAPRVGTHYQAVLPEWAAPIPERGDTLVTDVWLTMTAATHWRLPIYGEH